MEEAWAAFILPPQVLLNKTLNSSMLFKESYLCMSCVNDTGARSESRKSLACVLLSSGSHQKAHSSSRLLGRR